jgi:hypothetical protein
MPLSWFKNSEKEIYWTLLKWTTYLLLKEKTISLIKLIKPKSKSKNLEKNYWTKFSELKKNLLWLEWPLNLTLKNKEYPFITINLLQLGKNLFMKKISESNFKLIMENMLYLIKELVKKSVKNSVSNNVLKKISKELVCTNLLNKVFSLKIVIKKLKLLKKMLKMLELWCKIYVPFLEFLNYLKNLIPPTLFLLL